MNPYAEKPDRQFWRRSITGRRPDEVDPVARVPFEISKTDRIATAGSCFAQHIARYLQESGFGYFVAEDHPPFEFCEDENYGTFSARYGNVYTVRQLWQLFQRAYGLMLPWDTGWRRHDARLIDPFRPRIQAGGFRTLEQLLLDRTSHLAAVRRVFEDCDVFVFTLGLTEGWVEASNGAVVPLAPGTVAAADYSSGCEFHNFTVAEMESDLGEFITALRSINPQCRILLTVSPVALLATFEDDHVLTATTYSKAALRVVAEWATHAFPLVGYFPSYEIITGPHARSAFFADDLREVRPEGVAHVMSLFARHYLVVSGTNARRTASTAVAPLIDANDAIREIQGVICDEEQIDPPT
jgi:hypothetical protein